ncbi:MAG: VOC family protein [Desulfobacteraceae bacterium]|nr:VOC family protein [Desulfobacteraceae bacterium]
MTTEKKISGIHHITAVASSAAENLRFYENDLGLRLVKQTVNFDDPFTYHLYYGDAEGSPGTILTFFPWQNLPQGRTGAGMVTAINFAVPQRSMDFWAGRLRSRHIPFQTAERFGEPLIRFADPHGLPLELTGVEITASVEHWADGPVAKAHAIAGFHSATATLRSLGDSRSLLTDLMGMRLEKQEGNRYRYAMADPASAGTFYDIVVDPDTPAGRPGGGTVHHIAFRTADDAAQASWQSALRTAGVPVTEVRDRNYFRSIYFHAPERVLFEIATDPPGFGVDEPVARLGESLKLPTQLEPMRTDIESSLPPLRTAVLVHAYQPPLARPDDGRTIVTLHGTGGSENDLVPLAAALSRTSAILSPRGTVRENGMPRFFKRLAENVFDEEDVVRRANELADFLVGSAPAYGRDPEKMTALGYSNGANIAAAILLLRPQVFERAVLLRPMLPLKNPEMPDLVGKRILVVRGSRDTIIPSDSTDQLEKALRSSGADVHAVSVDAGHEITERDIQIVSHWLSEQNKGDREAFDRAKTEATV